MIKYLKRKSSETNSSSSYSSEPKPATVVKAAKPSDKARPSDKASAPPSRLLSALNTLYEDPFRQIAGTSSHGVVPSTDAAIEANSDVKAIETVTSCISPVHSRLPSGNLSNERGICERGAGPGGFQPDMRKSVGSDMVANCTSEYRTIAESRFQADTDAQISAQLSRSKRSTTYVAAEFRDCPFCSQAFPADQWDDHVAAELAAVDDESQWHEYVAQPRKIAVDNSGRQSHGARLPPSTHSARPKRGALLEVASAGAAARASRRAPPHARREFYNHYSGCDQGGEEVGIDCEGFSYGWEGCT